MRWQNGTRHDPTNDNRIVDSIPASYTIHKVGTTYYGECNLHGGSDVGPHTDAAAVFHSAWEGMPDGGRIHVKGDIDLGTTGLTFNLTKLQKALILSGDGETGTTFTFTGAGNAIKLTTADAIVGYYYGRLRDFLVDCSSITSGRHGICIDKVGRNVVVDGVKVYNADIGIDIGSDQYSNTTNEVYLQNTRVVTANTGVRTMSSGTNEVCFINTEVMDTVNYGYYCWGGSSLRWYGGMVGPRSGTGIYLYGTWNSSLDSVLFHGQSTSYDQDLKLDGADAANTCRAVNLRECYFNGNSQGGYAIYSVWHEQLTLDTCRSRLHNNAFMYIADNEPQGLVVINPDIQDTTLFNSPVLTKQNSRLAGTWIEPRRIGFIAYNDDADPCDEGDVMVPTGIGCYSHTTTKGQECPRVVMHGGAADKPIVLCLKGIADVEMEAAVTQDDIIVASNTETKGETDNAETDPRAIIGWAMETTGVAGKAIVMVV